jgi:hypothetical protein
MGDFTRTLHPLVDRFVTVVDLADLPLLQSGAYRGRRPLVADRLPIFLGPRPPEVP